MITVVGADTDASYYGLTTLYHILKQMDSNTTGIFTLRTGQMLQVVDLLKGIMEIHGLQKTV